MANRPTPRKTGGQRHVEKLRQAISPITGEGYSFGVKTVNIVISSNPVQKIIGDKRKQMSSFLYAFYEIFPRSYTEKEADALIKTVEDQLATLTASLSAALERAKHRWDNNARGVIALNEYPRKLSVDISISSPLEDDFLVTLRMFDDIYQYLDSLRMVREIPATQFFKEVTEIERAVTKFCNRTIDAGRRGWAAMNKRGTQAEVRKTISKETADILDGAESPTATQVAPEQPAVTADTAVVEDHGGNLNADEPTVVEKRTRARAKAETLSEIGVAAQ